MPRDYVDVYWAPHALFVSPLRHHFPVKSASLLRKGNAGNMHMCPALKDNLKNSYALKFPIDYSIDILNDGNLSTPDYDQEVFNAAWEVRSAEHRLYTLSLNNFFICEESLGMEVTSAHIVDNEFTRKTTLVPGTFDIGKWYRPTECAFFARDGVSSIKLSDNEPFAFIKFLTDKKVNIKKFCPTPELLDLFAMFTPTKLRTDGSVKKLSFFYDLFRRSKYRSHILKKVKENVLDG